MQSFKLNCEHIMEHIIIEKKPIGSDKVSAIGLGTWAVRDYKRAENAFLYALQHGIDNIDTAEMYDGGRAEEFVGMVVKAFGRDNAFITTKIWPDKLVDKSLVLKAAKASLSRLGIKYADLILIHWPNRSMSIRDQVRNFEVVYSEGLTRYIGVSNFNLRDLTEAVESTSKAEIVVNQVRYSVYYRELVEKELIDFCNKNKVTIQAYTPIEKGSVARDHLLRRIAEKYGKTAIQAALNYVIRHERVIAIVKSENIEHIRELMGSMGWRLAPEDVQVLAAI
ncbi:MAG: aldo/keto reductase [Thermofilaceae archaeon]